MNQYEFLDRVKALFDDKYDYSLTDFENTNAKIKIICPTHGLFEKTAGHHLRGQGCPKCSKENKKYSLKKFIEKAKKVHSDKYDYSLSDYVGSKTKIKIKCLEHGVFEQTPNAHLSGQGCPYCNGKLKLSTEQFIEKARKVHGDKYDYSQVNYVNIRSFISLNCYVHGLFKIKAKNHLSGIGCSLCEKVKTKQNDSKKEQFIEKAKKVHSDKYDYSQVNYENNRCKVKIICPVHGLFEQTPGNHLSGQNCPLCARKIANEKLKYTTESFVKKACEIHQNRYSYEKTYYVSSREKVTITCSIHGDFLQTPESHLSGSGCLKCANHFNYSTKEFIEKAKKVHGEKYDYSRVNYVNNQTKIEIKCEKHGIFSQSPCNHLKGQGCPFCNESKGEKEIVKFLDENNIKYEREKRFSECKDKYTLPFDFYLPDYNMLIEFDGVQHFKSCNRWGGILKLLKVQKHDEIKNEFAEKNGIKLVRLRYDQFKKIDHILGLLII